MSSINSDSQQPYEVIVLGAGVGGIYQIKRLTDLGISSILLETEADLGGTWYRNRYPGSRFDSESYTYGYSFSQELLDEWHWKERFSPQPENLRYLNYVADKFDLRKHMRFNSRVVSMQWDEDANLWHLFLEDGTEFTAPVVVRMANTTLLRTASHHAASLSSGASYPAMSSAPEAEAVCRKSSTAACARLAASPLPLRLAAASVVERISRDKSSSPPPVAVAVPASVRACASAASNAVRARWVCPSV